MPTVTMFTEQGLSNSLHNLGPLTTAFSAPESCSSGYNSAVATMIRGAPLVLARSNCSDEINEWFDDCLPSGSKRRSLASEKEYPALTTVAPIYYSPGLECPESWTTAGIAAKDADGKLSSSGDVFDVWGSPTTTLEPPANPIINMFIQALDHEETAVLCCPSNYEAIPGGGCYSRLHKIAWTYSELCSVATFPMGELLSSEGTFTYDEQTYTKMIPVRATETTEVTSYATTEMGPAILDARELVPVVYWPMVTLVHKADDGRNGEDGDSDGDNDKGDDGSTNDNNDENGDEDAAVSVRTSVGLIAGVWVVVAVLGAAVFM